MKIFKDINSIKTFLRSQLSNKTIGLVPTMGYLHEGHCSLVNKSTEENDITVVSIFVNPTQFGPNEDYEQYPRNLQSDLDLLKKHNVDVVFSPTSEEMYPDGYSTFVDVNNLTDSLCGSSRPGHFRGVTTVVTKLLNIVRPSKVYFGQKDAQQAIVIKQMINDFNMDSEIVILPIIREDDGLAMSSRNVYLGIEERQMATILYKSLCHAKQLYDNGERNALNLKNSIEMSIKSTPLANIDYISIVDLRSLNPIEQIKSKSLVALAVKFGTTRLIDNIILG